MTVFYLWFQVIGKALVLDEIINYIQSLQRQVEVDCCLSLDSFLCGQCDEWWWWEGAVGVCVIFLCCTAYRDRSTWNII